jgi:hypothetical protein
VIRFAFVETGILDFGFHFMWWFRC